MVVYGFPSKTAALRFEWGWTYPQKCTPATPTFSVGKSRFFNTCGALRVVCAVSWAARRIKEALSHRDLTKLGSPHMLKARLRYRPCLLVSPPCVPRSTRTIYFSTQVDV
jgi:hypothetical protein